MTLLTNREMALWSQKTEAAIGADPFAAEVNEKVSQYICFMAGHEEWTAETAPIDVRTIALWVWKRTYTNPDQEVQTTVGPLGSRVLDIAAVAMALTDSELETLASYKEAASGGSGIGLFLVSIAGRTPTLDPTVYVPDDQQVNLGSLDPWGIPFDTGTDVNQPVTP